ncbi:MAG: YHS domain-containing protein [bacterium]
MIATETEQAIDPICGMEVRVEGARYVSLLEGKYFYFCCSGCKTKFEKASHNFMVAG